MELARNGFDNWNRGDLEAMIEASTEEFEFRPAVASAVDGGSVHGPDEFRRFSANLTETWETFRIEAAELREIGDQVLAVGRLHAKGRGSGIELDQPIFIACWFEGGKFSRMLSFLDEEAAIEAASQEVVK